MKLNWNFPSGERKGRRGYFVFEFLALTVDKTQFIAVWCMSAKQKVVHGHGPSNTNVGMFVCFFDV